MAWTLDDMRQWLRDKDKSDGSAKRQREYDKISNDANALMHRAGNWDFDRKRARLVYEAAKTAGTVSINVDATAVTGSGTAFASGDVGKFFRFAGEDLLYRATAHTDATNVACEAYRGESNLSGASYSLTHDRVALPALFRSFDRARIASYTEDLDPRPTLDDLLAEQMQGREVAVPEICAVEDFTTGTNGEAPDAYLWLYPSPDEKTVVELYYYAWPLEMTTTAHEISAPYEARICHRAYMQALLLQAQGKEAQGMQALQAADEFTRRTLSAHRAKSQLGAKRPWTPRLDGGGVRLKTFRMAAGEPANMGDS